MTINSRIKDLRKHLDLNSRDFGAEINYSHSTVIQVEKGRCPEEKFIQAVCSKFNVSETWLRTGEGEMFTSPQEEDDEVYRRVLKQKVRSLPPEAQKMILDFCQEIQNALPPDINAPAPPAKKNGGP